AKPKTTVRTVAQKIIMTVVPWSGPDTGPIANRTRPYQTNTGPS
ncbi:unnamed protein product, partial [Allacma fusca]